MSDVELSAEEWTKAMSLVLAMEDDAPAPAPAKRILVVAGLNYSPNGGDAWSAKQPPSPGDVKTYTEMPPSGPGDSGVTSPANKPNKEPEDKWSTKVGTPQPTGKPTGSFAHAEDGFGGMDAAGVILAAREVEGWPVAEKTPIKAALATRARQLGMKPDGDGDFDYDTPSKAGSLFKDACLHTVERPSLIRLAKAVEEWPEAQRGPMKRAIALRAHQLGMKPDGDGDFDYDTPDPEGAALHESDTSKGWSSKTGKPTGKNVITMNEDDPKVWNAFPPGSNGGKQTGPPDGPTTIERLNLAPRTSIAAEDLDKDAPDNLSLPDGSFFIAQPGDIDAAVDKVKNSEQGNPHPETEPWYSEVKRHIARRADAMGFPHKVPADWQIMMASAIETARDYTMAERRRLASEGKALPNLSYPINSVEDLKNAIILARSGHGDVDAAKALIRRRAKELNYKLPKDF